jgi:hypothetical protein
VNDEIDRVNSYSPIVVAPKSSMISSSNSMNCMYLPHGRHVAHRDLHVKRSPHAVLVDDVDLVAVEEVKVDSAVLENVIIFHKCVHAQLVLHAEVREVVHAVKDLVEPFVVLEDECLLLEVVCTSLTDGGDEHILVDYHDVLESVRVPCQR